MNRTISPFWTLFILTGLNLFNYLDRNVLAAVLDPVQAQFNLTDEQGGRLNTAFMLGYFVTAPLFGYLGDRASRKWLIAVGIVVWSLGTVLTGLATSLGMMLGFRTVVGVGEASYASISPGWISDVFGPEKRNNALTIFYVALPVGSALGYILGGLIAAHWGWRYAFIWAGLPGLVLALSLLPFREPRRGQSEGLAEHVRLPRLKDLQAMFRLADFHLIVWGYVAYTFAMGAFAFWGPSYLHRVHHVAKSSASIFLGAVVVVAGLLGTFAGGFAATAWRRRNPAAYSLVLGYSTLAAVPAAVLTFVTGNVTVCMASLAVTVFLLFLSTGPVNTLIIETAPANLRASAMATSIFMIHLFGDLWSSQIMGALSDYWKSLQKAGLILPGALLIGAGLWLALAAKTNRAKVLREQ
jgi:MFS transporter, Spinster family, sphingosine-1-phosphate transporter